MYRQVLPKALRKRQGAISMKLFIVMIAMCLITVIVSAHPGRTDKYGGHKGPGGYHYHNKGSSSSSSSTSPKPDTRTSQADDILTSKQDIMTVQTLLKELGYYRGEIHGNTDDPTLTAADTARVQYGLSGSKSTIRRSLLTRLTREKERK